MFREQRDRAEPSSLARQSPSLLISIAGRSRTPAEQHGEGAAAAAERILRSPRIASPGVVTEPAQSCTAPAPVNSEMPDRLMLRGGKFHLSVPARARRGRGRPSPPGGRAGGPGTLPGDGTPAPPADPRGPPPHSAGAPGEHARPAVPSPPSSRSTAASPSRRPPSSSWRSGERGGAPRSEPAARAAAGPPAGRGLRAARLSAAKLRRRQRLCRHLPRRPLTSRRGRGRRGGAGPHLPPPPRRRRVSMATGPRRDPPLPARPRGRPAAAGSRRARPLPFGTGRGHRAAEAASAGGGPGSPGAVRAAQRPLGRREGLKASG